MTFQDISDRFEEIKEGLPVSRTGNRFFGEHKSTRRGIGYHFMEITKWRPGEPFKGIRWRQAILSNFREISVVRRMEQKKVPTCLVANISPSMLFQVRDDANKGRLLIDLIGAIGFTSSYFHDPVSFIGYSDRIEASVEPGRGTGHIIRIGQELYDRLELEQRYPEPKPADCNEALRYVEAHLKGHHTVVLVSDFVEAINNVGALDWELLGELAMRHTVIALVLADPDEFDWTGLGGVALVRRPQTGATDLVKVKGARNIRARLLAEQEQLVERFRESNIYAARLTYGDHIDRLTDFFAEGK